MDWQAEYRRKVVTAAEAVSVVKSGDRIDISLGQRPERLLTALSARKGELEDVAIFTTTPAEHGGWDWFDPEWQKSFRVNIEIFSGAWARIAMDAHVLDFTPVLPSLQYKLLDERPEEAKALDVHFVVVSPPDKNGYCSFGAALWMKNAMARRAKKTIAEVNPNLIRMNGDAFIHVSQIEYFVETNHPKLAAAPLNIQEHNRLIAQHVKSLVRDRDTLQIGIGSTSNCLIQLGVFDDANDIGAHTELCVPGYVKLIRRGIITSKYKTINRNKHVATAWSGDDEDMAFVDGNPNFDIRDSDYVINVKTIAAHDNMFTINNAISVDLTGQICAESIGTRMYNGTGGQVDFHIGAMYSKGGRAITVMPSTAMDGAVSRIVPWIQDGSYVTVPRSYSDIIVTEYGIARLLGRTHRQRAEALINIAHPNFREELWMAARKMFWP